MDDKLYPKDQFEADLQKIREMEIPLVMKRMKGNALAFIYLNQEDEKKIDRFAIRDSRDAILNPC